MLQKILVELIFLVSIIFTIFFVLRKPSFLIRIGCFHFSIESYFLGSLLGLSLLILFQIIDYTHIAKGLNGEGGLNPIGILILFLSLVFISIFLDTTGFFEFCALLALKFAGRDGKRLFFSLYITVSILTIFTSNDIIILTFTPFIYYFSKITDIDPVPYLISEFFAANTWSMMLYIGNPTNILFASVFNLKFDQYFLWMFLPTLAAGMTNIGLLYFLFEKKISQPLSSSCPVNPFLAIKDKGGAIFGLIILGAIIVALAVAPYFGIEMWIVSFIFALILLLILMIRDSSKMFIRKNEGKRREFSLLLIAKKVPWAVIPFVLSLFILVEALKVYQVISEIGIFFKTICGTSPVIHVFVFGITSALAANILNNIPMSVAFVPIAQSSIKIGLLPAILASIIGSNLGANITPIGALAGIMWMRILRGKDFHLSFLDFIKYGLLVTPITLIVCLGVLACQFFFY